MAMLTGVEDSREEFSNSSSTVDASQDAAFAMDGETYRSGPTMVATPTLLHAHRAAPSFADDSTSNASPKLGDSEMDWMAAAKTEQPFMAPQMQPFFQEDTVTQFSSTQPAQEIFNALLRAMREHEVMYSADREKGTVKMTSFVDHSRVEATFHVYRQNTSHLVRYGRNHGDRIPATRLFYTLANASGLVQMQVPRLLRKSSRECCSAASAPEGSEEKAASETFSAPEAATVYVDMLESMFLEEVLVGAQGLARACCCPSAAAPYVPHLAAITKALAAHRATGCKGHLVCRDIVACLAEVLQNVSIAAITAEGKREAEPLVESALIPLLQCAALPNGDLACARTSLDALTSISNVSPTLRKTLATVHKSIVADAVSGLGPCSIAGSGLPFLKASARKLQESLLQH